MFGVVALQTIYHILSGFLYWKAKNFYELSLPCTGNFDLSGFCPPFPYHITRFYQVSCTGKTRITTGLGTVANDSDLAKAIATALQGIKTNALATGNFSYNSTNDNAVADNLAAGYYLVESSLGTALVLDTLKDETIQTKNTYHTCYCSRSLSQNCSIGLT